MILFCTEHKLQHSAAFFSHIALNTQISFTTSHGLSGKNFNPLKQLLSFTHTDGNPSCLKCAILSTGK